MNTYTAARAWEDADLWMRNWMAAHPDETRDELDVYMSSDYDAESPYWPLRDVNGTLIDFNTPKGG